MDDAVDGCSIGLLPEDAPQSKSQEYIYTCSKSRRVRCSSERTSASSRARSLALFWIREILDKHYLLCIVIARRRNPGIMTFLGSSNAPLCWYSGLLEINVTSSRSHHWRRSQTQLQRQGSSASLTGLQAVTMRFDGWRLHPKPTCGQHDVRPAYVIEPQFGGKRPNVLIPWWVVTNRIA